MSKTVSWLVIASLLMLQFWLAITVFKVHRLDQQLNHVQEEINAITRAN